MSVAASLQCFLHAQIIANNNVLTVTTPSLVATFRGADLVGLTNSLTGENYLNPQESSQLLELMQMNPNGLALTLSAWTVGTDASTQQQTASLTFQEGVRNGSFSVTIDPRTRELVIHLSGLSQTPGVEGLEWGIDGIDLSSGGRVVLPSNGGNYFDLNHFSTVQLQYPTFWAAQMALFAETKGGFLIYSTDTTFQFKDLYLNGAGNSTANLQLSTEAVAPWHSATSVAPIEWRLTTFTGDWRAGASIYKTWSRATWPLMSPSERTAWVRQIDFAIAIDEEPNSTSILDTLATLVKPQQTLLHLANWTVNAAGTEYPDYTPNPNLKAFVDHAHSLGFHVELYVNATGVNTVGPAFTPQVQQLVQQFQMRTPDTLQPTGWEWSSPPSTPDRQANLNPAASEWRTLLLNSLAPAITAAGPDAIHLDAVELAIVNDGNGLIEGMNSPQGLVQLNKDALARFPNVVFGTEGISETSLPYCWVAQRWEGGPNLGILPGHPITTFLQGDQVSFYGHLNQPDPDQPGFLQWEQQYEAQGVLPMMHDDVAYIPGDLMHPAVERLLQQVNYWQLHAYRPNWNGDWGSSIFNYIGSDGATEVLTDNGTLVTLTGTDGTLYQRVYNLNRLQTSRYIDKWPAFDDGNIYGLDPAKQYWLDALPRPNDVSHLSSLPFGVKLGLDTNITSAAANVSLAQAVAPSFNFFNQLLQAKVGFTQNGVDMPIGNGNNVEIGQATVGGVSRQGIFENPPGVGSQTFIDYVVQVPSAGSTTFRLSIGIADSSPRAAPIIFSVGIDGKAALTRSVNKGSWEDESIDLSQWTGKTIHLRLLTDGGPTGGAYAWAFWSDLELDTDVTPLSLTVNLVLPPSVSVSGFTGSGNLQTSGATVSIIGTAVPGGFVAFLETTPILKDGQSLVSLPYQQYTAEVGQLPIAYNPSYGNPSIGNASSGRVLESGVLITHPSNNGRSILGWTVRLPNDNPVQLTFSVGLEDGWPTSPPGVTFSVLVNGTPMWSQTTTTLVGLLAL